MILKATLYYLFLSSLNAAIISISCMMPKIEMAVKSLKFLALSEFLIENKIGKHNKKLFYEYVKSKFDLSEALFECHRKFVDRFVINHYHRWAKKSKFRKKYFHDHFGAWLQKEFKLSEVKFEEAVRKDFEKCSDRTKKRRADKVRQDTHENEIELAFLRNLSEKDEIAGRIVKFVLTADDDTKSQIWQFINKRPKEPIVYTPNESLALMTDAKLTRHQYEVIQHQAKERNANIFQPYGKVLEAKKQCYPNEIQITDNCVKIPLQKLLDKTAERLIETCQEELLDVSKGPLTMASKWGMDGASGQSCYKQIFKDDCGNSSDSSIFMLSLVPLQIKSTAKVIWTNPNPSSTKLCRPIKFEYTKENKELTLEERRSMEKEIEALRPTKIDVGGCRFQLKHNLNLTMVDGKTINYLTSTSSTNCHICDALPTERNDTKKLEKKIVNAENYQFGLTILHCWIRFLECLLHIAFKLPVKKYIPRGEDEKAKVEKNKERIQQIYKTEKGLYLDVVRQGTGNSNDGNTARRFFHEPEFAAETTGLDLCLIKRFRVILIAMSSRKMIDTEKFRKYASDTADRYLSVYNWYYMPPSVHKVLYHGVEIMKSFDLPSGFYSEEAQEARNKDFRRIRECNTRKTSRLDTNEDIVHGLLISSDPIISSLRNDFKKKEFDHVPEVMELFADSQVPRSC